MKRRDFLTSLLAGATASVLPVELLASTNQTVWNAATLTEMLERMFACQMGPAASIVFANKDWIAEPVLMVTVDRHYPNQLHKTYAPAPEGYESYVYETYVAAVKGGTAEEAEAKLAKHFYEQFSKVPAGRLIWRTKPTFSSHEVVEFGETWMTSEALEDMRGNAPPIPEGVEYDISWGNYRYVKEKYMVHRMRARLVLPEIYNEEIPAVPSLFKLDGLQIVPTIV